MYNVKATNWLKYALIVNSVTYLIFSLIFFVSFEIYLVIMTSVPILTFATPIAVAFFILKYGILGINMYLFFANPQLSKWKIEQIVTTSVTATITIGAIAATLYLRMDMHQILIHPIFLDILSLLTNCITGLAYVLQY